MICIDEIYFVILVCIILFIIFIHLESMKNEKKKACKTERFAEVSLFEQLKSQDLVKKLNETQQKLNQCLVKNMDYDRVIQTKANCSVPVENKFLSKIYNPLTAPENVYGVSGGRQYGYDPYMQYQQLGYLTNSTGQYSVYGRRRYPNRSDKMEYYTINNEQRNGVKIPFKNKNYDELMDGDTINIPEIGGESTYKQYETEGLRYNPYLLY